MNPQVSPRPWAQRDMLIEPRLGITALDFAQPARADANAGGERTAFVGFHRHLIA
jgi:hypothetical protein